MATANYKFYKTNSDPGGLIQILPGTNTPYGMTEVSSADAQKYYSANPNQLASQKASFGNYGGTSAQFDTALQGTPTSSGLSQDAQGNWGNWDKINADNAAHEKAVSDGLETKVAVGGGFGYKKTATGLSALNTQLLASGTGGDPNQPGSPTYKAPTPPPAPTPVAPTPLPAPTSATVGQGINLISGGNLQVGTNSEQVRQLQTMLNANGANLAIDGNFGALTQAAVKAYQQAHGLVADGIVGANTNAALTAGTPIKPPSNVITANGLTSETPITIPPIIPGADNATAFVTGIEAIQAQAIKDAAAAQAAAQTNYNNLSGQISALLGESGGQGAATTAAEAAAGVPAMQAAVNEVNSQITTKLAQYNALNVDVQGKAITMNSIIGAQAQIKNVAAAEIGLLQAQASAMQGNLTLAKDTADKAVELKYNDIQTQIDIKIKQLALIQDDLTAKEKITSDLLAKQYDQQKTALNIKIANEKDLNATLLNAMQTYPDARIALTDSIETANQKIVANSKIYADKIRPPVSSTTNTPMTNQQNIASKQVISNIISEFQTKITGGWAGANPDAYAYYRTQLVNQYGKSGGDALDKAMSDAGITVDYQNK